jgi:protein-disulfide isomerase
MRSNTAMSRLLFYSAQAAVMIVLFIYTYSLHKRINKLNKKVADLSAAAPATPPVKLTFNKTLPAMGADNAKVVMTIFSDFECEFCKVFATQVLPKLKTNYVDKGLLKVYFRFLPLDIHKNAFMAAEAAAYVNEQGKFWDMHDFLFDNQHKLGNTMLFNWAVNKQLDSTKLKTYLQNHTYKKQVEDDIAEAHRVGISATPAIVVNGNVTLGAQSVTYFSDMIDKQLSAQAAKSSGACN